MLYVAGHLNEELDERVKDPEVLSSEATKLVAEIVKHDQITNKSVRCVFSKRVHEVPMPHYTYLLLTNQMTYSDFLQNFLHVLNFLQNI